MTLQMTMTFGDCVVTAGSVIAVVIAYYAIKAALATISTSIGDLVERMAEHDDTLAQHGQGLAALDAAVFGRGHALITRDKAARGEPGGRTRKDT